MPRKKKPDLDPRVQKAMARMHQADYQYERWYTRMVRAFRKMHKAKSAYKHWCKRLHQLVDDEQTREEGGAP